MASALLLELVVSHVFGLHLDSQQPRTMLDEKLLTKVGHRDPLAGDVPLRDDVVVAGFLLPRKSDPLKKTHMGVGNVATLDFPE